MSEERMSVTSSHGQGGRVISERIVLLRIALVRPPLTPNKEVNL